MVNIKSCHCYMCNMSRWNMGQKAKTRIKREPNRKFRHQTKQALHSQNDVPESIIGDSMG